MLVTMTTANVLCP